MSRWTRVVRRIVLAELAAVAFAALLTFTIGPRTRHTFAVCTAIGALAVLTLATAGIYGAEIRGVKALGLTLPRFRAGFPLRAKDRSGLPPEDVERGTEANIQDRPPRFRAMLPALVAFIIGLAIAGIIGVV